MARDYRGAGMTFGGYRICGDNVWRGCISWLLYGCIRLAGWPWRTLLAYRPLVKTRVRGVTRTGGLRVP